MLLISSGHRERVSVGRCQFTNGLIAVNWSTGMQHHHYVHMGCWIVSVAQVIMLHLPCLRGQCIGQCRNRESTMGIHSFAYQTSVPLLPVGG